MVHKTDLMLVMETTWIFIVAFLLPWLLHREFGRSTVGKEKRTTHLRAPGVVEPQSGLIVVVPLSPCPWYLQGVMVYAKD